MLHMAGVKINTGPDVYIRHGNGPEPYLEDERFPSPDLNPTTAILLPSTHG